MREPLFQIPLFHDLPEQVVNQMEFKEIRSPVWTENKAKLVAAYLRLFTMITKHGCYIDGFAGPKQPDISGTWAAELVLALKPPLLRNFFLCDQSAEKIENLKALKQRQPQIRNRKIEILEGDFNKHVLDILSSNAITPRMATFCLIDQFTAECHWSTVQALARQKETGPKIELFYFLASGWLDRALAGFTRNVDVPERWWGRPDWQDLKGLKGIQRALLLCKRFKVGYRYAHPWPIYERAKKGRIMFHMIHVTDHPEAPKLMFRAYRHATLPPDSPEQLEFDLASFSEIASAYDP
jgi:three-Cys-motif partner protein